MMDWRLAFTNAWRRPEIQEMLDKEFAGRPRMKMSREELEQLVVQCCSILMETLEKR